MPRQIGNAPSNSPATAQAVNGGILPAPLPEPGFVRFRAVRHPHLGLLAELNGPVKVTSGYGEHEVIGRPRQVGLLTYTGREPLTLEIPLLLDKWALRGSVEHEVRVLERLHGLDPDLPGPPRIIIEGIGIPHSYSRDPARRFVLSGNPEWGDEPRIISGARAYVEVVVIARQVPRLETLKEADDDGHGDKARRHFFEVPEGDRHRTLKSIARKFKTDWKKLRKLNPKLPGDPDHEIPAGTRVRVS